MMMRTYTSEGVVLSRRNFGEADRILTVYSKHFGKISLLAKGVRKPKSRKRGHIEIFSHIKFSVNKGKGLDLMTEATLIDSFDGVRNDLRKITVAYFLCEVINKVMNEEERNDVVFENFIENLSLLSDSNNLKKLRHRFIADTLIQLGFWPHGKTLDNPDKVLEEVVERRMNTFYIGRKMLN